MIHTTLFFNHFLTRHNILPAKFSTLYIVWIAVRNNTENICIIITI